MNRIWALYVLTLLLAACDRSGEPASIADTSAAHSLPAAYRAPELVALGTAAGLTAACQGELAALRKGIAALEAFDAGRPSTATSSR